MDHLPIVPLPEHHQAVSDWLGQYCDRQEKTGAHWSSLFDEGLSSIRDAALGQIPGHYRKAVEAWIWLGVEGGYFAARGTEPECPRLPTPADLEHSSLLPRILAGQHVFHHAPPTMMGYPWVGLVADRKLRLSVSKDAHPLGQPARAEPGKTYLSLSQSEFVVTEQSVDGWIYATSSTRSFPSARRNTFWKIRTREAELSEVEYQEAKHHNHITTSFELWRQDWPYKVWVIEVLNTPGECATYSGIDEILATIRPRHKPADTH